MISLTSCSIEKAVERLKGASVSASEDSIYFGLSCILIIARTKADLHTGAH